MSSRLLVAAGPRRRSRRVTYWLLRRPARRRSPRCPSSVWCRSGSRCWRRGSWTRPAGSAGRRRGRASGRRPLVRVGDRREVPGLVGAVERDEGVDPRPGRLAGTSSLTWSTNTSTTSARPTRDSRRTSSQVNVIWALAGTAIRTAASTAREKQRVMTSRGMGATADTASRDSARSLPSGGETAPKSAVPGGCPAVPFPMQIETARLDEFAAALRPRIAGDLRLDALSKALYATDASLYREPPLGVLIPRHTDDVQAALEDGARFGVPIVARGSGSSLAGSRRLGRAGRRHDEAPPRRSSRSTPRRARRPSSRASSSTTSTGPRPSHGLTFGPDPASSNRATLGGMLGTNATGTHSIQYGSTVDWIESAEVLLADGSPATFGALDAEAWAAKTQRRRHRGRGLPPRRRAAAGPRARDPPRHAALVAPRGRLPPGADDRGARGRPRAGPGLGRDAQPGARCWPGPRGRWRSRPRSRSG